MWFGLIRVGIVIVLIIIVMSIIVSVHTPLFFQPKTEALEE
jgi:hypothetical protein